MTGDVNMWMTKNLLKKQKKEHTKIIKEASDREFAKRLGLDFEN